VIPAQVGDITTRSKASCFWVGYPAFLRYAAHSAGED
jgi:hypothetical protein